MQLERDGVKLEKAMPENYFKNIINQPVKIQLSIKLY